jgi:formate hydrogenlyase subunit 6/NADH:ubiquinone oxidoreductase subunit I
MRVGDVVVVDRAGLAALLAGLIDRGFEPIGPVVRDGAIAYGPLRSLDDLPAGWHDEQAPGRYRLARGEDAALFGYGPGPHSWKGSLHPPTIPLWRARRTNGGFDVLDASEPSRPLALFGVRACDVAAIHAQDRIFLEGVCADPHYRSRRESAFVVAANCTSAGGTCFCASLGTGPRARSGFDLALTERIAEGGHEFVLEVGSPRGADLAAALPSRAASPEDMRAVEEVAERVSGAMGRRLDTSGLREALYAAAESPRWDEIGRRCLSCANCTLVCPTCFCTTVEDVADLAGEEARRVRLWDSCFSVEFSYIHGGSVRTSAGARYRQWLTHKLASWHDQFGGSGCVGCGRCITWCPAGIDMTAEAEALRAANEKAAARRAEEDR